MLILLLAAMMVPVAAQNEKSHILIFKHDGTVDTLLLNNVRQIYHSRLDANGVEQTDVSTFRLRTMSGECVYPLTEIDHVVMPKNGRVISFMGATQPNLDGRNSNRTSVDGDFPGKNGDIVIYKWVKDDFIYLENGARSRNVGWPSYNNPNGEFQFESDTLVADRYVIYYPGSKATKYNQVKIPVEQTQTLPDNSDHLGTSGDCGTAVATRQPNSDYKFALEHKTAVLCFIPRVDTLKTLVLKDIAIKSTDGKMLAGEYTLSPAGVTLNSGTGSDSIMLKTNNFMVPNNKEVPDGQQWEHTPQDTVASYMVLAPQTTRTPLKVYYHVADTQSGLDTVEVKSVALAKVEGATVYPVTNKISPRLFFTAYTDSAKGEFNGPATLYGSVNLPITNVGFIWGYNKNLTFDTKEADIPLTHSAYPELNFNSQAVSSVKQKAYYYRAYAKEGTRTWLGKVKKFGMDRDIINMGTSVRWSSINMGAVTAEDAGDHYAWGELAPKETYAEANYVHRAENAYTDIGMNIAGNPAYDVVTKTWRGCWRMPTKSELHELVTKCNWSWTDKEDQDGNLHHGLLVKNRNNNADSIIFLPAAGYRQAQLRSTEYCYYQSGTRHATNVAQNAYQYNNENNLNRYAMRWEGLSIRPVFESNIETTSGKYLFIRTDSISYSADHTSTNMYGTMRGLDDDVTDITEGFVIGKTEEVTLDSDSETLKVTLTKEHADDNGSYHLPLTKEQMDQLTFAETYYVRAYLTYDGETWYGEPIAMDAMTIRTDSTNWQVGREEARLCGYVSGITESNMATVDIGFVVGTTADVTFETAGHLELPCDSTVNGKFVCDFTNMELKQYYYRAYVRQGDRVAYGNPKMLGLELVDLGLPSGLRWANINLDAQQPIDDGKPYAWGEVTTKTSFSDGNYQYRGQNIGTDISGTTYDAAQVNWQGPWRMPTKAEVEELIKYCNWESKTIDGKSGHLLTSKMNGKSIFLPFTGHWWNGTNHYDYTWRYLYWTSTINTNNTTNAWYFDNYPSGNPSPKMEHQDNRGYGFYVRPVAMVNDTIQTKTLIQMTTDSVTWEVGQTSATLHGYLLGLRYNRDATESGFAYSNSPISDLADHTTAGVSYLKTSEGEVSLVANGKYQCILPGVEDGKIYYYRAYVKVGDRYYYANQREFGRRAVDLGLHSRLLWSNINLGASSPDDSGDYYAWGETAPKTEYSKSAYTARNLGTDISGSQYDAVHVAENWGGIWRMPTKADLEELITQCTWTEVTKYGQPMFKLVGPSGDSIFIAKSGHISGRSVSGKDTKAYVWTANLNATTDVNNENAYGSNFYGNTRNIDAAARYLGYAIRPVAKYTHTLEDGTKIYLSTDSTNWQVGNAEPRLCGSVAGLGQSVAATRGFVVSCDKNLDHLKAIADGGDREKVTEVVATASGTDDIFRGTTTYDKDTTYYYRAYVKVGDTYYYGNIRRYGLELVDMGNGVKWASLNVGSQTSSDYGKRYAWGEKNSKSSYTQDTYSYYSNGYENIGADISGSSRDVAHSEWGGTWRMPTVAEMRWLVENCEWQWCAEDNQPGYLVTSRAEGCEGHQIFLPAAGYQRQSFYQDIDDDCYYWTASLYNDSDSYILHGTSAEKATNWLTRCYGLSVRPVTTAGADEGGGGDITGGHNQGGSQQTGDEGGTGSGGAGTGDTGGTIGN